MGPFLFVLKVNLAEHPGVREALGGVCKHPDNARHFCVWRGKP